MMDFEFFLKNLYLDYRRTSLPQLSEEENYFYNKIYADSTAMRTQMELSLMFSKHRS